ncbi:uncharacterized protein PG986_008810 [Apiospora aurea]|uniref:Uncharacterized protein n=1 Tax=Apiospora aurea TaxID=335848 RepID=A0ABR1Q6B5_9PEZI
MGSITPSTDASLVAQKENIAKFSAFVGVWLVLATINGWRALVANWDCPRSYDQLTLTLMFTFMAEVTFTFVALCVMGLAPTESQPTAAQQGQPGSQPPTSEQQRPPRDLGGEEDAQAKRPSSDRCIFGFVGSMLGLEAAVLVLMFLLAKPSPAPRQLSRLLPVLAGLWGGDGVFAHRGSGGKGYSENLLNGDPWCCCVARVQSRVSTSDGLEEGKRPRGWWRCASSPSWYQIQA